jgi:hypothetical protein
MATGRALTVTLNNNVTTLTYSRVTTSSTIDTNWNHVGFTYDGTGGAAGITVYINGAVAGTTTDRDDLASNTISTTDSFVFAARSNGTAAFCDCNLSEATVYDKELSLSEVQDLYNSGIPLLPTSLSTNANLAGYYPLNTYIRTQATVPLIQGGPAEDGYQNCRWFDSVDDLMTCPLDTAFRNALDAGYSLEFWLYLEEGSVQHNLFEIAGDTSSELSANNVLLSVYISSSGFLNLFWEYSGGVNQSFADTTNTIPTRTWTHIGVTVENVSSPTISFYIDGSLSDSGTITTRADGGGNAEIRLCTESASSALHGGISDFRFSTVERSAPEIATSAAETDFEHAYDGSTLALWRFNEFPEASDSSTTGWHLAPNNFSNTINIVDPLIVSGQARYIVNSTTDFLKGPQREVMRASLLNEWTLEWWSKREDGDSVSGARTLLSYGSSGESLATNLLISSTFTTDGRLQSFWEYGSGTNVAATTPLVEDAIVTPPTASTPVLDFSTNKLDGTATSMEDGDFTTDTPGGTSDYSILLGGSEYVAVGDVTPLKFDVGDAFSISLWVKMTTTTTVTLVGKRQSASPFSGYQLASDVNGLLFQVIGSAGVTQRALIKSTATTYRNGSWHHVVATKDTTEDANNLTLYMDGAVYATSILDNDFVSGGGTTFDVTSPLDIGGLDSGSQTFLGNLDEVCIYNKELSLSEVQAIYNSDVPLDNRTLSTSANIVGYWTFDESLSLTPGQSKHHYALVKSYIGGSAYDVDFYYDGAFSKKIKTGVTNAAGGTSSAMRLRVGTNEGENQDWGGTVDDMRLSNIARTSSEILASYTAGVTIAGATTIYYQMVGNDDGDVSQPSPHTWVVTANPDPTGAQTAPPFGGPLSNIYTSGRWEE